MSMIVLLEFHARPDVVTDLVALLEKILPETRAAQGFHELLLSQGQDDPGLVVSHETWSSREAFETYLRWRQENGTLNQLGALLAEAPVIRYLDILQ
jgi:quinol monooxygenase YgiN